MDRNLLKGEIDMGVYIEDFKAVADYVLEYDEVKKVVPEEIKEFEEKVDAVLVAIRLMGYEDISLMSIFEYMCNEEENSDIERDLSKDDFNAVEEMLKELFDVIGVVEDKFEEKTKISIYNSFSKTEEKVYFEMRMDDVVELTPQAKALKESGVKFEFQSWVDEW
jgi:hypothetical protein